MKTKPADVRRRILRTPCWAHNRINEIKPRGQPWEDFASRIMSVAVVEHSLTASHGELYDWSDAEGSTAMPSGTYRVSLEFPRGLDAAFEALAKAHGMTYQQAFAFLLGWVAQHTFDGIEA